MYYYYSKLTLKHIYCTLIYNEEQNTKHTQNTAIDNRWRNGHSTTINRNKT